MNLDDFRCMRQGRHLSMITQEDMSLLKPINIRKGENQHALLLLHGFSSSPAVFRRILNAFSDYDAIIAPVLPGHVENLNVFANAKASEWIECVEGIAFNLQNEFANLDVLGLSLGGVLASHLSKRIKLHHLYLLAPAFDLHLAIPKTIRLAKMLQKFGFKKLRSIAGNIYSTDFCEIAYRQLPLTTIIEILSFIEQFQFIAPTCPTDIFLGRHDEVVASAQIAARFQNKNMQIHWLENSAHVLPLDGDIETITKCVQKNLKKTTITI